MCAKKFRSGPIWVLAECGGSHVEHNPLLFGVAV
jgi:hypothetical protein